MSGALFPASPLACPRAGRRSWSGCRGRACARASVRPRWRLPRARTARRWRRHGPTGLGLSAVPRGACAARRHLSALRAGREERAPHLAGRTGDADGRCDDDGRGAVHGAARRDLHPRRRAPWLTSAGASGPRPPAPRSSAAGARPGGAPPDDGRQDGRPRHRRAQGAPPAHPPPRSDRRPGGPAGRGGPLPRPPAV